MNTFHTGIDIEYLLLLMIIVIVSLIICVLEIAVFRPFREERCRYKLEISRTCGEERTFWKKELKYFYIRSIPFFGKKIYRRSRRKNRQNKTFGGEAETALEVETQQLKNNFSATMFKKLRKKDLNET